jgi:hypothetical protein
VCLAAHGFRASSMARGPTSGNVKLLLPPRQSRGNSHYGLGLPGWAGALTFLSRSHGPPGDVADSLDEAKAAFQRAFWSSRLVARSIPAATCGNASAQAVPADLGLFPAGRA